MNTGSPVSLISTSLWDQLHEKFTRTHVKSKYVVANETTLHVKGSTELPIQINGLEVIYRFIIVRTKVGNILFGYEFLKTKKCDIMTSVNSLVAGNVVILTHSRLSITSIGIVAIADSTIKGFTKVIVPGQTESHEAYLTNEPPLCHDIVQQKGIAGPPPTAKAPP